MIMPIPTNSKKSQWLDSLLRVTTWKVGPEAASHLIARIRWNVRGYIIFCIGSVFAYIGIIAASVPALVAGIIFYVITGYCIVLMFREAHQWRLAASEALGIPPLTRRITKKMIAQGMIPEPPKDRNQYLAWCAKYGQKPYPFKPPDASFPSNPPGHPAGTPRNTQQQGDGSWGIPDGGWGIPEHPTDRPQTNP